MPRPALLRGWALVPPLPCAVETSLPFCPATLVGGVADSRDNGEVIVRSRFSLYHRREGLVVSLPVVWAVLEVELFVDRSRCNGDEAYAVGARDPFRA